MLADVQQDGETYQVHLQAAAAHGSTLAQRRLVGPELPLVVAHVWDPWFKELNEARERSPAGVAPCPITWPAMDAYFRLRRVSPRDWEISLLRALDRQWLLKPDASDLGGD
jgi:hypothetical protein